MSGALHRDLTGRALHPPYNWIQDADPTSTDPDDVFDGQWWFETDSGTVYQRVSDAWVTRAILAMTEEEILDLIGTTLVQGTGITLTVDDGANTVTIATTITQYTDEMARDALGTALVAGDNITITVDDVANTITIASTTGAETLSALTDVNTPDPGDGEVLTWDETTGKWIASPAAATYTDEMARDAIAAALTNGSGITITPNDGSDTIEIAIDSGTLSLIASISSAVHTTDTDASGFDWVIDEDDLLSNLDTKVPTQQSVKAYVDDAVADLEAGVNSQYWIQFTIDGGGDPIETGVKLDLLIPYDGVPDAWYLLADQSGDIVIDLWQDATANYPPTDADTITNAHEITASSAAFVSDMSLSDWGSGTGATLTAGNTLRVNVDSCSAITRCTVALHIMRT
jgi:uncharacterized Zn ribbon protein